jgi:hypothetical protein
LGNSRSCLERYKSGYAKVCRNHKLLNVFSAVVS